MKTYSIVLRRLYTHVSKQEEVQFLAKYFL